MAALTGEVEGQVIGWSTRNPVRLWLAQEGRVQEVVLSGRLRMEVGLDAICAGRRSGGVHTPCPDRRPATSHSRCARCSGVEDLACVFEPKCARPGQSCTCDTSFGGVDHVVYVAWYGILPKVGMTQARRLEPRLQEQGADAGFVVCGGQGATRGWARQQERNIALLHRIPESRRRQELLAQLARPVAWDALVARAEAMRSRLRAMHGEPGPLLRVTDHAWSPVGARPSPRDASGTHDGYWLGGKGAHLLVRSAQRSAATAGEAVWALRAPELVGRSVTVGAV